MRSVKKSATMAIAIVTFLAFTAFTNYKTETVKIQTSAVCGSCETTLKTALSKVDGVKSVSLNVDNAVLTVKYDSNKADADKIRKAISLAGYDADDVKADPTAYENLHSCCKKDAVH
ncbi:MAG TPA: heavy-metal-associated domain-containing protein [Chitinophagales bacterium]|nr:heavy-metal-associated domain-containing protein [Chitinophagales bacterium]